MRFTFFSKEATSNPGFFARHSFDRDSADFPVRFRPTLVTELTRDHAAARAAMRGLLDHCRARRLDEAVNQMRIFADVFRHVGLLKSVQLHPYLRWALQRDAAASMQLQALLHELDAGSMRVSAVLNHYLSGPWNRAQRSRFVKDIAHAAQWTARDLRREEASIFPLYLPPGQYKFVGRTGGAPYLPAKA